MCQRPFFLLNCKFNLHFKFGVFEWIGPTPHITIRAWNRFTPITDTLSLLRLPPRFIGGPFLFGPTLPLFEGGVSSERSLKVVFDAVTLWTLEKIGQGFGLPPELIQKNHHPWHPLSWRCKTVAN